MDQAIVNKVLTCSTLPSLPAVAVRVLELTADENVNLLDLGTTIQHDQALSAKILRTVNSSYYGLRERCTTIHKAILLLGMGPVRALALGFSLVSAVDNGERDGFDHVAYWRRGLYTGVAAQAFAERLQVADAEEAFLGGLLQDVGMVALHEGLGAAYARLTVEAGCHADLARLELERFDVQHTEIGALLAESWKLPAELAMPIRYHERPTAAPTAYASLVRCVALGNAVHDALTDEDPTPALRTLYARGKQWFRMTPSEIDDLIVECGRSAKELGRLFRLNTGPAADAEFVLEQAERQLIELTRSGADVSFAGEQLARVADRPDAHDPLTGAFGPDGFDRAVRVAFASAKGGQTTLTVAQIAIDHVRELAEQHGEVVRDELVIGLVATLHKHFEPMGGVVCRLATDALCVVLPDTTQPTALAALANLRAELPGAFRRWLPALPAGEDPPTISIGLTSVDERTREHFRTPAEFVVASVAALKGARAAGGNGIQIYDPPRRAA